MALACSCLCRRIILWSSVSAVCYIYIYLRAQSLLTCVHKYYYEHLIFIICINPILMHTYVYVYTHVGSLCGDWCWRRPKRSSTTPRQVSLLHINYI